MNAISISNNVTRVPNLLAQNIMMSSLTGTQRSLLDLQVQLATGKAVNRASDNAVAASAITVLDDVIERRTQTLRNLSHADAAMSNVDAALADASGILLEAKSIGLSQIGVGSDPETRNNQAEVIDAMLNSLITIANRDYLDVHLFGGSQTDRPPFESQLSGLRYSGTTQGMVTDLGFNRPAEITVPGPDAFGALSARVEGALDLNPSMTLDTRIEDLGGARGLGVSLSTINININGIASNVDLTDAHRVEDIITILQDNIPGATVQIDPVTGDRFEIIPGGADVVTISDLDADGAAADLGLDAAFPPATTGSDVNPKIRPSTRLEDLDGVTYPLGSIQLENDGQVRVLDLSGAETVEDFINAIAGLQIGIRAEINANGDGLNVINELSGGDMSIGEVGGGASATELGIRSLSGPTLLADFNNGIGVEIRSGSVDPITGSPDPAADVDFRITLKDTATFDVDLAGAETVQDVLDMINAAAATAGVAVPAAFEATLADDGNGIQIVDNSVGVTTTITAMNGSAAAEQLGILGSFDGASMTGEDRATVAVESVFTHLMDLRDALRANDTSGISIATDKLEADISRVAQARAANGVRMRRVVDAITRNEDLNLQDESLRSEFQDLDFTEASIRFSSLQQQLQAGLTVTGRISSLTLLDFLR